MSWGGYVLANLGLGILSRQDPSHVAAYGVAAVGVTAALCIALSICSLHAR
jgi:hypothetical protein